MLALCPGSHAYPRPSAFSQHFLFASALVQPPREFMAKYLSPILTKPHVSAVLPWSAWGHPLMAGCPRQGKSNTLQLLVPCPFPPDSQNLRCHWRFCTIFQNPEIATHKRWPRVHCLLPVCASVSSYQRSLTLSTLKVLFF